MKEKKKKKKKKVANKRRQTKIERTITNVQVKKKNVNRLLIDCEEMAIFIYFANIYTIVPI